MAQLYPEDIGSLTAARSFKHTYLIVIRGTSPSSWSALFCSAGSLLVDDFVNLQIYQPAIIVDPDLVGDSGGPLTTSFTLAVRGPVVIGSATYSDLYEAMRVNQFIAARVEILQIMRTQGGSVTSADINCRITRISNMTALSATFEVEQIIDLDRVEIPARVIDRELLGTDAQDEKIPEESMGKVLPTAWGSPFPHIPPPYNQWSLTRQDVMDLMYHGVRPRGFPCISLQKEAISQRWAWSEIVDLDVHPANVYERDAFIYEPQVDAYAHIYDYNRLVVVHDSSTGYDGVANTFRVDGQVWATIPILCSAVHEDSTGVEDGEKALTPALDSFAVVQIGGTGYFEIPSVQNLGRIAGNFLDYSAGQDDREYYPAPPGLRFFCVVASDSPTTQATGYELTLVWPTGTETLGQTIAVNALSSAYSVRRMTLLPEEWLGTPFSRWDFSAETEDTTSPLYSTTNAKTAGQMRIKIDGTSATGADLRVFIVGVRVGYLPTEIDGTGVFRRGNEYKPQQWWDFLGRRIRWHTQHGRHSWGRGRDYSRLRNVEELSNAYMVAYGYRDTTGGKYSGTASGLMRNPASWIWAILESYAEQSEITTGSSMGSFVSARSDLNRWATYANGGTTLSWDSFHSHQDQASVKDGIDDILDSIPDSQVLRAPQGGYWRMHVWIPREDSWTKYNSGTPVHPVHILDGSEGLAIEFGTTHISNTVNHIEVKYDRDPGSGEFARIASCSSTGSDDGYGNEWALTPSTAVAAKDLAFWSKAQYGKNKTTIELPFVTSPKMATAVGLSVLWRHYRVMPVVSFSSTLRLYDMEPWHVFRFDDELEDKFQLSRAFWGTPSSGEGSTWENIWWRVTRSEQTVGSGGVRSMQIEAEWYPTVIGTGVQAGAGTTPDDPGSMLIGEI